MSYELGSAGFERVVSYFGKLGALLPRPELRQSFALYGFGLLGSSERKSVEPLAASSCTDAAEATRAHGRLLHFLAYARWCDRTLRMEAAGVGIAAMESRAPVTKWIIDDTGFLKQGKHSVGVNRQYTGSAGKITNCQTAVSLSVASDIEHLPIDFALYLPKIWCDDATKRKAARIPDSAIFQTKPELALAMIRQAKNEDIPGTIVLADAGYGTSVDFRNGIVDAGLDYAVGINGESKVWLLDEEGRPAKLARSAKDLAIDLGESEFRHVTWREGTCKTLASRFCFRRVRVAHDDGTLACDRVPLWLIMEWPEDEDLPTKFALTSLPKSMSHRDLVRTLKERWRTERAYQDLKGELGLDHFEGRSFPGWHHHVTVALCCYAFVVSERMRHFSPSAPRESAFRTIAAAARTPLQRFVRLDSAGPRARTRPMASALPALP